MVEWNHWIPVRFNKINEWAGSVKATVPGDNNTGGVLLPGPLHRTSEESNSLCQEPKGNGSISDVESEPKLNTAATSP